MNGGGSDAIAFQLAGGFTTVPVLAEYVAFRNGLAHGNLTPSMPRTLAPRGPWTWTKPVVLLAGRDGVLAFALGWLQPAIGGIDSRVRIKARDSLH